MPAIFAGMARSYRQTARHKFTVFSDPASSVDDRRAGLEPAPYEREIRVRHKAGLEPAPYDGRIRV